MVNISNMLFLGEGSGAVVRQVLAALTLAPRPATLPFAGMIRAGSSGGFDVMAAASPAVLCIACASLCGDCSAEPARTTTLFLVRESHD